MRESDGRDTGSRGGRSRPSRPAGCHGIDRIDSLKLAAVSGLWLLTAAACARPPEIDALIKRHRGKRPDSKMRAARMFVCAGAPTVSAHQRSFQTGW